MQKFKQDCNLNLLTFSKGKKHPILWGLTITCLEQVGLQLVGKSKVDTLEEVEASIVHYGLELVTSLKQEKVEIRANFDLDKFFLSNEKKNNRYRHSDFKIQQKKCEIISLWESIRLKRTGELANEDIQKIQKLIST